VDSPVLPGADYGIDAPPVIRNLIVAGLGSAMAGFVLHSLLGNGAPSVALTALVVSLFTSVSLLASAGLMVWSSRWGKLLVREHLIDTLALQGDENVLDIGCGRGLMLIGAARRLTSGGRAVGIDLWQREDQSGNDPAVTLENARAEGVEDRIDIRTGDMRTLPFPDESFDAVFSSLAIHNIPDVAGRAKAIQEIARVTRPAGQVALLDLRSTGEYAKALEDLGWKHVEVSTADFRMFPPVRIVRARKPA
jgi:arsenite methyltransferase